ncbi:hypothetical protein HK104_001990 [Borealophlyctis nickersoniae]|nr:hypothetical protein HK104_001990 [Borealophlyctis nickersoniae]
MRPKHVEVREGVLKEVYDLRQHQLALARFGKLVAGTLLFLILQFWFKTDDIVKIITFMLCITNSLYNVIPAITNERIQFYVTRLAIPKAQGAGITFSDQDLDTLHDICWL